MEQKKSSLKYLVIFEFIIIIALAGLLIFMVTREDNNKSLTEPTSTQESEPAPTQESEPPAKPNESMPPEEPTDTPASQELPVVTAFKNYYVEKELADLKNISTWEFTTAKPVTNTNYKGYYEFSGQYSCKDNSSDCVYLEQVGDPIDDKNTYEFTIFAKVEEKDGMYEFSDLTTSLE